MSIADGVSGDMDKVVWSNNHENELPKWSSPCRKALLIQPSSSAAERVFSVLSNCFKEQQMHLLEDYIETSVMIQDGYYGMVHCHVSELCVAKTM